MNHVYLFGCSRCQTMFSSIAVRLLFGCFVLILLAQVHACQDYASNNDTEAFARRSYFYVGGQYVQTTSVQYAPDPMRFECCC